MIKLIEKIDQTFHLCFTHIKETKDKKNYFEP